MQWYEEEVRELERQRTRRRMPPAPVVFYGSSSIRLWTTLAADLGDARAVNLGFGGSTLEACVWFFDRLVTPARPASLVVYAGDNDLGDGRTPRQILGSFEALVAKVGRTLPRISLGYISIKPSPARAALTGRIVETNDAIRRTIAAHATAFYIDVFTPMLTAAGEPRGELFTDDGLHLNRAGYELWTRVVGGHRHRIFTSSLPGREAGVVPLKLDVP